MEEEQLITIVIVEMGVMVAEGALVKVEETFMVLKVTPEEAKIDHFTNEDEEVVGLPGRGSK